MRGGLEVSLTSRDCICADESYSCVVSSGIAIAWLTNTTTDREDLELSVTNDDDEIYIEKGGFQVSFRREPGGNYYSTLHITDLSLNETELICEGTGIIGMANTERMTNTTVICVRGNISDHL